MFNTKYKVGDKILVELSILEVEGSDGHIANYKLNNPLSNILWAKVSDLDKLDKTPKDQKKQRLQQQISELEKEITLKKIEIDNIGT